MELADTVSVDVPVPPEVSITLMGFNPAVREEDEGVALRVTVSANPLTLASIMVDVPEDPWAIVREEGLEEIVKSRTTKLPVISERCMEQ